MTNDMNNGVPWYITSKETVPETISLEEDVTSEIAIIGAGVMGLSTALSLAEAGIKVIVLEAFDIGSGASGRNGGLIVPIMKASPNSIRDEQAETGERLIQMVIESADYVFSLIDKYHIACDSVRNGFLQPVHSLKLMSSVEKSTYLWSSAGSNCEFVDAKETEKHLGTDTYHGALFEPAGGYVNPIAFTRGLAKACITKGVNIYTNSAVEGAKRISGEKWKLSTAKGAVIADKVIQCVSVQIPGLHFAPAQDAAKSLVPIALHGLATKPLPDGIRDKVLPNKVAATDTRNYVLSVGYDSEYRIVTSGAAPFGDGRLGMKQMAHFVSRRLQKVYPELGQVSFDYMWKGNAALNNDWLPKIYSPTNDWYSLTTCNGRGMALSTSIGQMFGKAVASDDYSELSLPIVAPKPIRFRKSIGGVMARVLIPVGAIQDWWRE